MNVVKCDRCWEEVPGKRCLLDHIMGSDVADKRIDLCPACFEAFGRWLKRELPPSVFERPKL